MRGYDEEELMIGTPKFPKYKKLFAEAGRQAAKKAKEQGLAVTYIKGDFIIQEYPNGEKKILSKAPKRVMSEGFVIKLPKTKIKK